MRTDTIDAFNASMAGLRDRMLAEIDGQITFHEVQIADLRTLQAEIRRVSDRIIPKPEERETDEERASTLRIASMLGRHSAGDQEPDRDEETAA
jgi:hypothetical protein